jgi:acyl transferase domain-containing protein
VGAGETLSATYWRQHTRSAVQFAEGMQTLATLGYDLFVEVGPQTVLSNMGRRCLPDGTRSWLPSLRKDQDDWQVLLASVAALYVRGVKIDWAGFDRDYVRHRVALPTYPFEREYCWLETDTEATTAEVQVSSAPIAGNGNGVSQKTGGEKVQETPGSGRHPLLASHVELVFPSGVHVWETALDKQRLPYLSDHRIQGAMAVPVSLYIEMAQAATVEAFGPGAHRLTEIELKKLLLLPEQGPQKVQVVLSSDASEHVSFHVYSHSAGVPDQPRHLWTLHASGKIRHN